jgi:hypothetical protein
MEWALNTPRPSAHNARSGWTALNTHSPIESITVFGAAVPNASVAGSSGPGGPLTEQLPKVPKLVG